jgi:hypothetical protein
MVDVVEKSTIIEEEERRAGAPAPQKPLGALRFTVVVLAILLLPALIRPSARGLLNFDSQLLAEYAAAAPDYVFIGNSMLRSRIDEPVLEARLGKHCCFVLWTGGAESAWTHQALENIVLASPHRPKKVFIFFRDTYLTQPTYRATDRYWWKIERLSRGSEPDLDRAMASSRTWQEQLEFRLGELYPVQKMRERASGAMSWLAGALVTPGRVRFGQSAGEKYDGLFDLGRLRSTVADDTAFGEEDLSEFDFDAHIDSSLVPSMIRMAKQAGVGLVFIRVQRRPSPVGPPAQRPELAAYVAKLRVYLARNGVEFHDFTGDPELTLDHYMDGDHIRADWRPESTLNFLRRLSGDFE